MLLRYGLVMALSVVLVGLGAGCSGCGDERPIAQGDTGIPTGSDVMQATDATDPRADGATSDGAITDVADAGTADGAGADATDATGGGDGGGPEAGTGDGAVGGTDAQTFPDAMIVLVDTDGDGIEDADEGGGAVDTDNDGTPDSRDTDSDGDGIPDADEAGDGDLRTPPRDSDGDGTPDFRDLDSDADGILDAIELTGDPDGDGRPNFVDLDSDADGLADQLETAADLDGDGSGNWIDLDADGDGVLDAIEGELDPDLDGTANFLDLDSDGDTIGDAIEGLLDTDGDGLVDRLDLDADNDALLDALEAGDADLTTPARDTDRDGVADFRDLDSDGDTIVDLTETLADRDGDMLGNAIDLDSDGDGHTDAVEAGDADPVTIPANTDLDIFPDYLDLDSDNDGLPDAVELGCPGSTSRTAADSDADGQVDPAEVAFGSNACNPNVRIDDFYFSLPPGGPLERAPLDFVDTNIDRADVAFSIDTTASMGEETANLRAALTNVIIPGVRAAIADLAVAVASFEDVPIAPFGLTGDLPFRLSTRVTTNVQAAQNAVNALIIRDGFDPPEAGMAALYQIATGAGFRWPGGSIAAFNPAVGRVPGVADGAIGGVGFRANALPIVVQVTDALAHQRQDYTAANPAIDFPATNVTRNALAGIGARVVGIANARLPHDPHADACANRSTRVFGTLTTGDVDWFSFTAPRLQQVVTVESVAQRSGSPLDTVVAVYDRNGVRLTLSDDAPGTTDGQIGFGQLNDPGTYYVAVAVGPDYDFDGVGGAGTQGFYELDIRLDGQVLTTTAAGCRLEDGNSAATARPLVPVAQRAPAANVAGCRARCEQAFDSFVWPSGMATETGALVPPCAWDQGATRPATCAANQCCTGVGGAGRAPNEDGLCPLSFQIQDDGVGASDAVVTGIRALVGFSTFTITTEVRPDPAELAATGFDTTCFIQGVVPLSATTQNGCAPQPTPADLVPPAGVLDSFVGVAPGTQLLFDVQAQNLNRTNAQPCRPTTTQPQLYRAFIDVVADGVTVVDTHDVYIVVPPQTPGGTN